MYNLDGGVKVRMDVLEIFFPLLSIRFLTHTHCKMRKHFRNIIYDWFAPPLIEIKC